jgi:hypothetical protein
MTYNQLPLQTKAGIVKNYLQIRRYENIPVEVHNALSIVDPEVEFNNGTCFLYVRRETITLLTYKNK